MKKIYLFLDIDGVLNHLSCFINTRQDIEVGHLRNIDESNVSSLNYLLAILKRKDLDAYIVISSSWRKDLEHTERTLFRRGLNYTHYFDSTNFKHFGSRGRQIKDYITEHGIKENYIIIEDSNSDIKRYLPETHILKTSGMFANGLTTENVNDFVKTQLKHCISEKTEEK